jgi:spermidine synthase
MRQAYHYATAFVTGFVVLSVEIVGTRLIAPFYGTTMYVWASLITITLGALSLGYAIGGRLADRRPTENPVYYIIAAAGAAVALLPFLSRPVLELTWAAGPRAGVLLSAFLLFFIPLLLLGAVSPYFIRILSSSMRSLGASAGTIFAVSTAGSLAGAIVSGFFLLSLMGVGDILRLNAAVLVLAACGWFLLSRQATRAAVAVLALVPASLAGQEASFLSGSRQFVFLASEPSAYTHLEVADNLKTGMRCLLANNTTQSDKKINGPAGPLQDYLLLFEKAVAYAGNPSTALVIGLGSGAISERLSQLGLDVDSVEVDPAVVKLARAYFGFTGRAFVSDGRAFVRQCEKKYGLIIVDVYNGNSVYPYLFSTEAVAELKRALMPGGMLVYNSIGDVQGEPLQGDAFLDSVFVTLRQNFAHVAAKASGSSGTASCIFFAADRSFQPDADFIDLSGSGLGSIITDDYNTVEFMTIGCVERWQRGLREGYEAQ